MATRSSVILLLVLLSLFSVLGSAEPSSLSLEVRDSNRTANSNGYCDYAKTPKDINCSSRFSGDYYGIGVRLGIYFTWLASWLANVFLPDEAPGALDANTIFLLSVMASIFYGSAVHSLSYIDGLILMHISSGYLFGCLSFWGYRTKFYQAEGPIGIRHFGRFGTHCRLVLAVAISGYGAWFWIEGIKDGLIIPVDSQGNRIPCQCYPLYTFFFGKLRVLGGIRYFYILMSTSCTLYYTLMLMIAAAERTHHVVHVLKRTRPVFESVIYETGLTRKELDFLYNFLRIGNILWMIFVVIMVELTLNWNRVSDVIGPNNQIAFPAQLLPMLIGAFSLIRVLFLLFWEIYEPEDKEQGETATAPPEDAAGNLSAANEARATRQGLGLKETPVASPTSNPKATTVTGHDHNHHPVPVRRSRYQRYMVAWLPWLSQFPFWTEPAGGRHVRPRGRIRHAGKHGDARDSGVMFLRRSLLSPNGGIESPAQSSVASPQIPKADEKV